MIRNAIKRYCHQYHYPSLDGLFLRLRPSPTYSLFHSVTNDVEEEWKWNNKKSEEEEEPAFQISHPWPEWVDLMKCLLKKGHFHAAEGNPFRNAATLGSKESNLIRTACLNFGRDHSHLLR